MGTGTPVKAIHRHRPLGDRHLLPGRTAERGTERRERARRGRNELQLSGPVAFGVDARVGCPGAEHHPDAAELVRLEGEERQVAAGGAGHEGLVAQCREVEALGLQPEHPLQPAAAEAQAPVLGLQAQAGAAVPEGGGDSAAALDLLVLVVRTSHCPLTALIAPPSSRALPASAGLSRCMSMVTSASAMTP
jgi:hypothetical protein